MEKPLPGTVLLADQKHKIVPTSLAWSPDGKRIASIGLDHTVQVWDATNGSLVYTYRGQGGHMDVVVWSPDGKRIAWPRLGNTVQVWDATDGNHVYTYRGHAGNVEAVAWSPDGKRIASAGWGFLLGKLR